MPSGSAATGAKTYSGDMAQSGHSIPGCRGAFEGTSKYPFNRERQTGYGIFPPTLGGSDYCSSDQYSLGKRKEFDQLLIDDPVAAQELWDEYNRDSTWGGWLRSFLEKDPSLPATPTPSEKLKLELQGLKELYRQWNDREIAEVDGISREEEMKKLEEDIRRLESNPLVVTNEGPNISRMVGLANTHPQTQTMALKGGGRKRNGSKRKKKINRNGSKKKKKKKKKRNGSKKKKRF